MIEVVFKESKTRTGSLSLEVTGHAGAAKRGQDTVCASATFAAYMLAQNVLNYHKQNPDAFKDRPLVELGVGRSLIKCEPTAEARPIVTLMYLFTQTGYQLLAHNYSKYVKCDELIGM